MAKFKEYDQRQGFFRTIIPDELLEENHQARIINIVVEYLDLEIMYNEYSEEGCSSYHPKMLLKILFYSYMQGTMSSRGMWNNLKNRADYIFLSGDQVPDFRTLNRFRFRVKKLLPNLFTKIVLLCVELGLVDFEHLAIDGQKIQANASFRKSRDKERYKKSLERIQKGIDKLVSKEPNEYFSEEKIKKSYINLKKQKEKLEACKDLFDELEKGDNINLTDMDAKTMKHKDGRKVPSYNHQSAVDGKHGITVAVSSKQDAFDHGEHLFPLVDLAKENTGKTFKTVLADCGFCDFERLIESEKREEDCYLPDRDYKKKYKEEALYNQNHFKRNKDGQWICPAGHPMKRKGTYKRKDGIEVDLFIGTNCASCKLKNKCTKSEKRQIGIDCRIEYRNKMREKLDTEKGRYIYSKRQGIVGPPHGHDQKNLKWRQHHLRGLENAKLEFMLIRIGSSLGKIIKYAAKKMKAYA